MGEAKRRGTREQRAQESVARNVAYGAAWAREHAADTARAFAQGLPEPPVRRRPSPGSAKLREAVTQGFVAELTSCAQFAMQAAEPLEPVREIEGCECGQCADDDAGGAA